MMIVFDTLSTRKQCNIIVFAWDLIALLVTITLQGGVQGDAVMHTAVHVHTYIHSYIYIYKHTHTVHLHTY